MNYYKKSAGGLLRTGGRSEATEHSSRWNWIIKKWKWLAHNETPTMQRMEATKVYKK
ncbi:MULTISPECIES: hypothetical protein [unclassified Bacillus cereus group]|uniref:hypothetical protein n=1 Tax=unclassified Bacillus cereus group TaxID=2750818 RepID=UPI0024CAF725|nr:MAG: hypothetical protein NRZ50_09825 [Bacillus paranthracis]WAI33575.1 MAG: hypothetical protein NRZ52_05235 [Bacillus paranthracis]WAI38290.1 MAG: hypothetical protein NRZ51_27395 [Bacillus paranthracis]